MNTTTQPGPLEVRLSAVLGPGHCASEWGGRQTGGFLYTAEEVAALLPEIDRLIAMRDDEGDRLDWLMVKLAGSVTRELLGVLSHTGDPAEFGRRIDEVRGAKARCLRPQADGGICGLVPPCPDCGRACHDVPGGA